MTITDRLDRLAAFETTPLPVISLYLNTQPDQHGRANFNSFVRKEFATRGKTYPLRSPERESFERDVERVNRYLERDLRGRRMGLHFSRVRGREDFSKTCNWMRRF